MSIRAYRRNEGQQQQEASIQIIEQSECPETIIIPWTHSTERNERTRVLLYLQSIMVQNRPSDSTLDELMPWHEWKKLLTHGMPDMSNDKLKGVFKLVDQDKDGKISLRQCLEELRAHTATTASSIKAALREPQAAATAADQQSSYVTVPLNQVQTMWGSSMSGLFVRPFSMAQGNDAESMQRAAARRDRPSSAAHYRSDMGLVAGANAPPSQNGDGISMTSAELGFS